MRGGSIVSDFNFPHLAVNPVIIDGLKCELTKSGDTYKAKRLESGKGLILTRPTRVHTLGESQNQNISVIWVGTNDIQSWKGISWITDYIDAMVDHSKNKKYIVVGLTSKSLHPDVATKNGTLQRKYMEHFLDIRTYILEYGLLDANITPTEADTSAIESGEMPPSLLADNVHFNDKGYDIIANQIYKKGVELGYW